MAMSDSSERTAEVWRDVPATEATMAQMVQMQQQMQQQMQFQMQHQAQMLQHLIQLQEDGVKQLQLPMPTMTWPQTACRSSAEPSVRREKVQVRPGRLGKRERAELKARSSRSPEAEISGDDSPWLKISKGTSKDLEARLLELEERCGRQQATLGLIVEERGKLEERSVATDAKVENLMAQMGSFEMAIAEMPAGIEQKVSFLEGKLENETSKIGSKFDGDLAKLQGEVDSRNQESEQALKSMKLLLDEQTHKIQETQASASASSSVELSTRVQSQAAKIDGMETALAELRGLQEEKDKLEEFGNAIDAKMETLTSRVCSLETAMAEMPARFQREMSLLEGKLEHEASKMDSKLDGALAKLQGQVDARSQESDQTLRSMQFLLDEQAQTIQKTQVSASASSASASDLSASVKSLVAKIGCLETAVAEVRSLQEERFSSFEAKLDHEMSKVDIKLEETLGRVQVQLGSCQEGFEQQIRESETLASGTFSDFKNSWVAKFEQLERRVEPALSGVDAAVETSDLNDENTETSSLNPQEPAPAPAPDALWKAIKGMQSQVALDLLKLQEVPGLNDIGNNDDSTHRTRQLLSCLHSTLVWAICCVLPEVALAIVQRPDFKQVNSKTWDGRTCLHHAAAHGYLDVVQAILARSDFRELHAKSTCSSFPLLVDGSIRHLPAGSTALDVARIFDRHEVVRSIESRLREV